MSGILYIATEIGLFVGMIMLFVFSKPKEDEKRTPAQIVMLIVAILLLLRILSFVGFLFALSKAPMRM